MSVLGACSSVCGPVYRSHLLLQTVAGVVTLIHLLHGWTCCVAAGARGTSADFVPPTAPLPTRSYNAAGGFETAAGFDAATGFEAAAAPAAAPEAFAPAAAPEYPAAGY